MGGETQIIPTVETSEAPRRPLHLRYFSLLRSNANFRRLWLAQLISEIGDWFYSLAVYDLLLETTQSGKAVAWAIIIQMLPWFFMTPLAGVLVDRFPRRRMMILADIVRGFVVLGLLLARTASDVWLVYTLLGLEVIFASIFEPARNALLPNLTRPDEILPANALSSATWSFALTVGAALGGAVTSLLGRQVAFIVNSLSFFLSAVLIQRIASPELHLKPSIGPGGRLFLSVRDGLQPGKDLEASTLGASPSSNRASVNSLREGWAYLTQNPKVMVLVLAKAGLGCWGGGLLLLAVFGERIFPLAGQGALAMGLLYAARGAGAAIGPLIGDRLTRGRQSSMWRSISVSFFIMGTSYIALSRAPNLPVAALVVCCAHMAGSNIWVMSTTLLQLNVADRYRGRIFALDLGMIQLMAATSNYLVGVGLETWRFSARQLAFALGAVLMVPGLLWLPAQATWAERNEPI